MELYRPLHGEEGDGEEDDGKTDRGPGDEAYLDYLEMRRQLVIQELRFCDSVLVPAGRLRAYTLPKRVR